MPRTVGKAVEVRDSRSHINAIFWFHLRPGSVPGFSCCQADDLSNHQDANDDRIDMIFSLDALTKVKKARVLGAKVSDKSGPFGLWPSDHGSVAAALEFD